MTLAKVGKRNDILETMVIHENGVVSYRGFSSYESLVDYRKKNKKDRVIIKEGSRS